MANEEGGIHSFEDGCGSSNTNAQQALQLVRLAVKILAFKNRIRPYDKQPLQSCYHRLVLQGDLHIRGENR